LFLEPYSIIPVLNRVILSQKISEPLDLERLANKMLKYLVWACFVNRQL
jgi:hypothetical protein